MKRIIVINGIAESGKDTFILYCKKYTTIPIYEFLTIDTIKSIMKIYFRWDGVKNEESRC